MKTGEKCEHCGSEMESEFVDIGIGFQQVTESRCPNECDYIEWEYQQYVTKTKHPLSIEEWLKQHESPIKKG